VLAARDWDVFGGLHAAIPYALMTLEIMLISGRASRATARPRALMTSPRDAAATTADAFCLSARMPTSAMCTE